MPDSFGPQRSFNLATETGGDTNLIAGMCKRIDAPAPAGCMTEMADEHLERVKRSREELSPSRTSTNMIGGAMRVEVPTITDMVTHI